MEVDLGSVWLRQCTRVVDSVPNCLCRWPLFDTNRVRLIVFHTHAGCTIDGLLFQHNKRESTFHMVGVETAAMCVCSSPHTRAACFSNRLYFTAATTQSPVHHHYVVLRLSSSSRIIYIQTCVSYTTHRAPAVTSSVKSFDAKRWMGGAVSEERKRREETLIGYERIAVGCPK